MTLFAFFIVASVLVIWLAAWNVRSLRGRQLLLLVACYLFYSTWGIGFLSLLVASSLVNFGLGSLLRRRPSIGYLWLGIALNVLLLGFFKYLPPILETGTPGSWYDAFAHAIIMPIGLSFWTFQALSYLIDVYLEEELGPSVLEFCLYMAFWPTVVSGPVCRLGQMLSQFRQEPVLSSDNLSVGILRVVKGLFMKMCLAQLMASGFTPGGGVTAGFDDVRGGWGGIDVWLLGLGFGFMLFFDFAGYSHMVIGTARIFGIRLPENFDRPFLSTTPSVFWTRWHMSLSFWIRDYIYKPLAMARRDIWWLYVSIIASMTLFGLWHGPKWTYVAYGMYHGVVLVLHRSGQRMMSRLAFRSPRVLGTCVAWATTLLLVSLGYILFRANDLSHAAAMLRSAFTPAAYGHFAMPWSFYALTIGIVLAYFSCAAGGALLVWLRTRYRDAVRERAPRVAVFPALHAPSAAMIVGAVVDFLATKLWWWLGPALCVLGAWIALAVSAQRATISVTPFIYKLF
jgi:alginate O-acetyltransferase complex protein AlgI